jgi:prepilin-type N-terminal cleavage/methylation domain-containing protein
VNQSCGHNSVRRRDGFTLVEMLVVLGIILLLIGIIVPAINKAYTNAVRTRMADDLQAIVTAMEHYKSEHGDIPRTSGNGDTPQLKGAIVLCRAMVGPGAQGQDGADGPGFRVVRATTEVQGRVYGPYLPPDRFKIVAYPAGGQPAADYSNAALADRNGKPILYYPGLPASDPRATTTQGYVANATYTGTPVRPMFNAADNDTAMTLVKLQHLLGDTNHNGRIDGREQPEYVGEYILLGGGPDQLYGPLNTTDPIGPKNPCDDVANFPR